MNIIKIILPYNMDSKECIEYIEDVKNELNLTDYIIHDYTAIALDITRRGVVQFGNIYYIDLDYQYDSTYLDYQYDSTDIINTIKMRIRKDKLKIIEGL